MRILSLSTFDQAGGAEKVALDLHREYLNAGCDARLVVKWRRTNQHQVFEMPRILSGSVWGRWLSRLAKINRRQPYFRGQIRLNDWLATLAHPLRLWQAFRGDDNYHNPLGNGLLDWEDGWQPDVVHCHNLHGGYFDLASFPGLSAKVPVLLTLHDTWWLAGHCGYFVDCDRWRQGCGQCPDLKRYPAIKHDATARNHAKKRDWLRQCANVHLITPSRWLLGLVQEAKLNSATRRVIPNGVDLSVFNAADGRKMAARRRLALPEDKFILLGSANLIANKNPYKDNRTVAAVCQNLIQADASRFHGVLLGGGVATGTRGGVTYGGYVRETKVMADFYRAADVFIHAAQADNFPCTVLEAQACGTPVIATDVGGVAEQIIPGQTGFLVERGNAAGMTAKVLEFSRTQDRANWNRLAAQHVQHNFDLRNQVAACLQLMNTLIKN